MCGQLATHVTSPPLGTTAHFQPPTRTTMHKLRERISRPPIGGWQWKEAKAEFKCNGLDELVDQVTSYREQNGLPIGDVQAELAAAWAEHSPWTVCMGEELEKDDAEMLAAEAREWLLALWRKPPAKLLSKKEAEPRYEKCLGCPNNVKLPNGTQGAEDLERRALLLTRGLDLPKELGCCKGLGWHNRAAVLIPASKCDEWIA